MRKLLGVVFCSSLRKIENYINSCTFYSKLGLFFNIHLRIWGFYCLFVCLFKVSRREREEKKHGCKKHQSILHTLTRDQTCNLGMCPHQELNPQLLVYNAPNNQVIHPGAQGRTFYILSTRLEKFIFRS